MTRLAIPTRWTRVLAALTLATSMSLVSSSSGNAALDFDGGELTRFEIDGDAVPGVRSDGTAAVPHVVGDWGLVEADFGYGPQAMGSTDPAPAGIGSAGLLPLVFDQSRADDHPLVVPAPNPQYPFVPGATEFCPDGEDDNWEGGAKTQDLIDIDNPLIGPDGVQLGCGQTLDKGDLFRAYAAYEIVAIPTVYGDPYSGSQNHTVLYGAWERGEVPGELNFYIPVSDSTPGNSAGDRLIAFDYNSSTTSPDAFRILAWDGDSWEVIQSGTAGDHSSVFHTAVGFTDGTPFPANGQPSFGEFALDLTATGVLPTHEEGQCVELMTAGYIFTETGNSASAQLKDYVVAPRLPIGNCGAFDVVKAGPDVPGIEFGYRAEQEDQAAIFPLATLPAGQSANQINELIAIGETDRWSGVFAQPDYLVFEPNPLLTDPPMSGWSQISVDCTYVDAFTSGYPIVTERLFTGTVHELGAYLQVQPDAFLELTGHAGFVPSCTITNEAAGIIIEKQGAGDPAQPFAFEANDHLTSLTLGELEFVPFDEGTPVTITELPLVGADPAWDLTAIECYHEGTIEPFLHGDLGTRSVTFDSGGFTDTVRCVFTNVQRGSITVEKTVTPPIESFVFESAELGDFVLGDAEVITFSGLQPGTYVIDEVAEHGWDLTGIACESVRGTSVITPSVETGATTFELAAGDAAYCHYINEAAPGELVIEKVISGAIDDGLAWSFGFELSDPDGLIGTGNITGVGGVPAGPLTFTGLVPGTTYTVSEWEMPPGWTMNSMTCTVTPDDPQAPPVTTTDGTFEVTPGSAVLCEFDNSPGPGELTVEKVISGAIDDGLAWSFGFELSDPDGVVGTGDITGTGGVPAGPLTFADLVPGTAYTITETTLPDGWTANSMTCTVTPAVPEGLPVTTTDGTFYVLPGSTVLCEFDNSPDPGSITVAKTTEGADGDFTFAFAAEGGPPLEIVVTTTDGAGAETVTGLVPGTTYTITEIDPGERWIQGDLLCTVEHADGSAAVYDAAGFTVEPGDNVACGMTNVEQGVIIVDKVTLPADDSTSFDYTVGGDRADMFSLSGPDDPYTTGLAPPGTYVVTELAKDGWVFQGAVCDGETVVDGPEATIELDPGDVVTCTFTNARRGPLTITKTVTEGPTKVGVDTYELTYQVEVVSESHVAEVYDLVDEVLFGDGVLVTAASATGPAGVTLEADWDGLTATLLADDVTIDSLASHVYTIEATGVVEIFSTMASRDCVLEVDETGTGFLNVATVTWSDGSASDDDCRDTPDPDEADLAIVKTASVSITGPEGSFEWILDVVNNGPAEAVNVVVGDLVPDELTVTGVTSSDFTCAHLINNVSCTKAVMAAGETGQVVIAVSVPDDAVEGSVVNVGTVESDTPETDLTNNSDDATVDIVVQLSPTTTTIVLPATGSDPSSPLWAAAVLLIGGAAMVLLARRRRSTI